MNIGLLLASASLCCVLLAVGLIGVYVYYKSAPPTIKGTKVVTAGPISKTPALMENLKRLGVTEDMLGCHFMWYKPFLNADRSLLNLPAHGTAYFKRYIPNNSTQHKRFNLKVFAPDSVSHMVNFRFRDGSLFSFKQDNAIMFPRTEDYHYTPGFKPELYNNMISVSKITIPPGGFVLEIKACNRINRDDPCGAGIAVLVTEYGKNTVISRSDAEWVFEGQ